jgi:preprotein translocase subunit SecG
MLSFLLAIHFVLAIAIIGLILLQKHDSDGALGSSGGGMAASGMFSVRGQATLLTRATAVLMTLFIINCLVMAKMVKHTPKKESIIDSVAKEYGQHNRPGHAGAEKTSGPASPVAPVTAPGTPAPSPAPVKPQTPTAPQQNKPMAK